MLQQTSDFGVQVLAQGLSHIHERAAQVDPACYGQSPGKP